MRYTRAWDDTIRDSLSAGTFTPFLGAGAASLRSYDSIALDKYPWKEVAQTLREICRSLPVESRSFLRNFVGQRLRLTERDATRLVPIDDDIPRKSEPGTNLVDLQIALVNAMRQLTKIFGDAFIDQVPSLRELPDCAVKLSYRSDAVKTAWLELFKAIVVARDLKRLKDRNESFTDADSHELPTNLPHDSTRRFNVACVYQRLVVLARQLIPQEDESLVKSELFEQEFKEVPDLSTLGDDLIETNAARGHLRLDMMQWLGDLLEYSLGYWIPRFPTTAELAFELGLAVPSGPPRRAELAQAAQAFHATDPKGRPATRYIKDLMKYCQDAMGDDRFAPGHRRFYLAIAVALCDQWDRYVKITNAGLRSIPRTGGIDFYRRVNEGADSQAMQAAADQLPRAFLPVAATTNYDCGLELVLQKHNIPHHVVFPIQTGQEKGTVAQWVCRRVMNDDNDDVQFPSNSVMLPDSIPLAGPVIVKLHGAPTLKEVKDGRGGYFTHKLVVSEEEYLEALQGDAASLTWFEQEMFQRLDDDASKKENGASRTIWFLGYSIADWNVRLRLYSHLRSTRQGSGKDMHAVNRDYDPFRQAILKQLQIELCHGDLSVVPRTIYEYYKEPRRRAKSSESVRTLVNEMDDWFN